LYLVVNDTDDKTNLFIRYISRLQLLPYRIYLKIWFLGLLQIIFNQPVSAHYTIIINVNKRPFRNYLNIAESPSRQKEIDRPANKETRN